MIEAAPSRWFHSCRGGVRKDDHAVKVPAHSWIDEESSHWCCPTCLNFGTPESTALWGHEWAVVAWMALEQYHRDRAEKLLAAEIGEDTYHLVMSEVHHGIIPPQPEIEFVVTVEVSRWD